MQKGYFSAAWGDLTHSPGWFGALVRLSLLCFVPVFGVLVAYGYLYGWARDIAWNVHRPLSKTIFGNEDGGLYKRGFFILIIGFVFSILPGIFSLLGSSISASIATIDSSGAFVALFGFFAVTVIGIALSVLATFFIYVGSMRTAIYGTVSAGFQLGKIWAMLRYDFTGLLRIFAMSLIIALIYSVFVFIAAFIFILGGIISVFALVQGDIDNVLFFGLFLIGLFLFCWLSFFVSMLIEALVARALGYWTRQFDVHLWGGQDDLMPFERAAQASRVQQMAYYQQPQDVNQGYYQQSYQNWQPQQYQQQTFAQTQAPVQQQPVSEQDSAQFQPEFEQSVQSQSDFEQAAQPQPVADEQQQVSAQPQPVSEQASEKPQFVSEQTSPLEQENPPIISDTKDVEPEKEDASQDEQAK